MKICYRIHVMLRRLMAALVAVVLAGGGALGQPVSSSPATTENPTEELVCGTTDKYTPAEAQKLPWFNNNQFLVDFLRERGVPIAPDYVSRLRAGKPTGPPATDTSRRVQRGTAAQPKVVRIKVWVYHNNDGSGGVTRAQVDADVRVLNESFALSRVPVRFVLDCTIEDVNNTLFYDHPTDA